MVKLLTIKKAYTERITIYILDTDSLTNLHIDALIINCV